MLPVSPYYSCWIWRSLAPLSPFLQDYLESRKLSEFSYLLSFWLLVFVYLFVSQDATVRRSLRGLCTVSKAYETLSSSGHLMAFPVVFYLSANLFWNMFVFSRSAHFWKRRALLTHTCSVLVFWHGCCRFLMLVMCLCAWHEDGRKQCRCSSLSWHEQKSEEHATVNTSHKAHL